MSRWTLRRLTTRLASWHACQCFQISLRLCMFKRLLARQAHFKTKSLYKFVLTMYFDGLWSLNPWNVWRVNPCRDAVDDEWISALSSPPLYLCHPLGYIYIYIYLFIYLLFKCVILLSFFNWKKQGKCTWNQVILQVYLTTKFTYFCYLQKASSAHNFGHRISSQVSLCLLYCGTKQVWRIIKNEVWPDCWE